MTEAGVNPEEILMMTFSKAAADDMKKRYVRMYGNDSKITFCTIHSFCLAVLKKYRSFNTSNVISPSEVRQFFLDQLSEKSYIGDKYDFIKALLTDIGRLKDSVVPLEQFIPSCCSEKTLFDSLYKAYEEYKSTCSVIDYDDMLLLAYKEMQENEECLDFLQKRYRYVMVDEYQDTSMIQARIIDLLCSKERNLCVVGDDDQSIYRFRGADSRLMLGFSERYPEALLIRNGINYRCCERIITGAARLIRHNEKRYKKDFTAFREEKGSVNICEYPTRSHEVKAVTEKIKELVSEGVDKREIAILYRNNVESAEFAEALLGEEIPVYAVEIIESKYENFMFGDLMAYHRLSVGTGSKNDVAHTINRPQRFLFGSRFYDKGYNEGHIIEEIEKESDPRKRKSMMEKAESYFSLIRSMEDLSPALAAKRLWAAGYKKYVKEYENFRQTGIDYGEMWQSYIRDAKKCGDTWPDYENYVNHYNHMMKNRTKDENGVRLSSMHASKGLEWKYVFIVDAVLGTTPYSKCVTEEDLEEERRLFYVACTRAKDALDICWFQKTSDGQAKPSPFIREFTGEDIKKPDFEKLNEKHLSVAAEMLGSTE